MLFNSYGFIFIFLPIVLLGFHLIGRKNNHKISIAWLVGASLFFYGWWNPAYLGLLLFSIIFNYSFGMLLSSKPDRNISKKTFLVIGIVVNLSVLGYFKYANFFIDNLNSLTGMSTVFSQIILPLGISFFTFQQITYLVDSYYKETNVYDFLQYCLFVTFFPQLIAGPIVHHREMLPQFARDALYRLKAEHLAVGGTIFTIGLFKKVVLADGIAIYATPVFDAAEAGVALTIVEAWGGALAYSLQLYFDFSGYSDMAIGLARMFGVRLPLNFNSPYKATNISDFWRRWHITLSRLIREYLWDPISLRLTRYAIINEYGDFGIFILTVLSPALFAFFWIGLWHGAGWNFIIFGLIHGCYIVIHSLWIKLKYNFPSMILISSKKISKILGWLITFITVTLSWVLFRSETMDGALQVFGGMVGMSGTGFQGMFSNKLFVEPNFLGPWIIGLILIAVALPNTQQILRRYRPAFVAYKGEIPRVRYHWLEWRPSVGWGLYCGCVMIFSLLSLLRPSEFLYFQF